MKDVLPFILVLSLSGVQFLSSRFNIEQSRYRHQLISFAAAIALTYLLFSLLPKAYHNSSGMILYVPLMGGFALIYLIEKSFFRKFSERFSLKKLRSFHDELHVGVLFIYHFVIGSVLIKVLEEDISTGLLFLPPLVMFTTIGNWSLHHVYLEQLPFRRTLLALSTVFGALFAKFALIDQASVIAQGIEIVLLNFVSGVFLFLVVKEALPRPKEGDPVLFIAGILAYGVIIYFLGQMPN